MTRLLSFSILLLATIVLLGSCAAPKYGCPANTMGNGKFRG
ncbi:MAG: hypothetical protein ACKO6Q_05330 [Bacteroidota bacterium]